MLDYHLHLWPHSQRDAEATIEQVAAYCRRAVEVGVEEIALTEHLFRFTQAKELLGGFWDDLPGEALRPGMAAYWDHHARVDLDTYVEVVQAVKAEGLPVVLGLEVDFYQDRMDEVAGLLADYPFDVLLGSVHWLGTWRFDVLNDPLVLAEWDARNIDAVWDEYTRAMEELAASGVCDVFAHPDLVKIAGRMPAVPDEFYDRIAEAAVRSGMAAELSSAGWRKPVGEEYPAPPLLRRFIDRGVPLTTASDAHSLPDVADRADDLRDLLVAAGVTRLRAFHNRQPYEVTVATPEGN
ncbi:MAG TPA: histidinol-phosphatase [Acidimicrobiales bacterium]|nr:histidinol-phosphatase [Acidimicrobiales bacterium]